MNKKIMYLLILAFISVALVSAGVYFFQQNSSGQKSENIQTNSPQNFQLISKEEAKIQELSPEVKKMLEQSGTNLSLNIENNFNETKFNLVNTNDGSLAVSINDQKVIPIYQVISASVISDTEIVITSGKYSTDSEFLTGDKKAYIYNYKDQTVKIFYKENEEITDLFALFKDKKLILYFGNRVDMYDSNGVFVKNIFTSSDKKERIIVADQNGVPENKLLLFSVNEGRKIVDL